LVHAILVALQRKQRKTPIWGWKAEKSRKFPRIANNFRHKSVRGNQTIYMTGVMANSGKDVTAGPRAVPVRAGL
jgi:hypothetical protein